MPATALTRHQNEGDQNEMAGRHLEDIFPGDSEMAREMRGRDWAATPLGDPLDWPDALQIPLRMLLTSRFEMWLGWGPDLHFFYNDAYIPTLGVKHPAMLGKPFREVWSEVYDEVADQVASVRRGEATWNKALLLLLERSGFPEETYHSFSYSPLYEADGSVGGLLCVVSEETQRVIAERQIETVRQLGLALAGAADAAAIRDAVRESFAANQRDFPFAALQLAIDGDAAHARDAATFERLAPALKSAEKSGAIIELPDDMSWPSGDWDRPPTQAIAICIPGPDREAAIGWLVLGLNPYRGSDADLLDTARLAVGLISGALANAATLQAERRRADRMWTFSRDLMVVIDGEGRFLSVNPAWTRILGYAADDLVGRHFSDFMHPDDVAASTAALAEAMADRQLTNYANRLLDIDGEAHWIEWHTSMEGNLVYGYGRDVTERHVAKVALNESQEQFRHLVQGVTDYAIYMLDLQGHVSSWNEGARHIKGYEPDEIIGQHFSRFYTDEDRAKGEPQRALETARKEGRFNAEGWRVRKSGERFRASVVIDAIRDDDGRPIGFAKITRDITEREAAQRELERAREALFQSQKMDAIGQLTGGVAHDFNNLLMAILGSLDLLRKRIPDEPVAQRLLNNAVEGAQRGATLTQRMLAFARRQDLTVDRVDLVRLLESMNDLVQRSIGPEWPISMNLPLKLPAIRADANQLEMALLNLIVNARDATPDGGPILISASPVELGGKADRLPAGDYVRLVVEDRGAGMDAETLRRATEPFFTTKGVGKGTGLGLPMVHGMAQQIGGLFELVSRPGEGTSAVLWLPVDEKAPAETAPIAVDDSPPKVRRLTILAVDDDALVLLNTAALLEDLGHEVIEADSAAEALDLLRQRDDIDLIVTDQAMPNMTGTQLIAEVERIRPGTRAIIASGYGEGVEASGDVIRLSKPFNQAQLARAVADAVERADA
jgi:PAS domain S-box-containing protein